MCIKESYYKGEKGQHFQICLGKTSKKKRSFYSQADRKVSQNMSTYFEKITTREEGGSTLTVSLTVKRPFFDDFFIKLLVIDNLYNLGNFDPRHEGWKKKNRGPGKLVI